MNSKHNAQPRTREDATLKIIPEHFTPSAELQLMINAFNARRDAYLETQQDYQAAIHETARLEQAAGALEAEAEQANANWKEMAMNRRADQRKINAEVERSIQLKMDAEKFRRTAAARTELRWPLVKQMAHAREGAAQASRTARARYALERIRALLATPGLAEVVGELRALADDSASYGVCLLDHDLDVSNPSQMLAQNTSKAGFKRSAIFNETGVPGPIDGEELGGRSLLAAKALDMSNGKTADITEARRLLAAN